VTIDLRRTTFSLPQVGVPGALALALATGFITWVVLGQHGSTPAPHDTTSPPAATAAASATIGPVALSAAALRARVKALGQPVYWLGPVRGDRYELKRTADGSIFLRYLPAGVQAGNPAPLRTVGTYPFPAAYSATHRLAQEASTVWFKVGKGGVGVFRRSRPTNVYLAWPGVAYQVEVFDARPGTAKRLADSRRLRLLAGS